MQGISHGNIQPTGELTPEKAKEFVRGQSPRNLPETAPAPKVGTGSASKKAKKSKRAK